ncbi:MAG TPA: acyloxyacyl hydrolase [Nitrococcus sp.]|nr:acyloxyacyl hydrolase [Nitrococcus sp.]
MPNHIKRVLIGVLLTSTIASRTWAAGVQVGAGAFDWGGSAAGLAELRLGTNLLHLGSAFGVLANTDGGVYGYGGLYFDLPLGRFAIIPLGAVGFYHQGSSKDLGGVLEFRGSITAAYALANGSRVGIQLGEISNLGLYSHNPGEGDIFLTYTAVF